MVTKDGHSCIFLEIILHLIYPVIFMHYCAQNTLALGNTHEVRIALTFNNCF